jgi:predicted PurR-regulated permease PerM
MFNLGSKKNIQISITTHTIVKSVVIVGVLALLMRFIGNIVTPLRLIGIAAFLAIALNPTVTWISRKTKIKSRIAATAIAYLVVVFIIAAFSMLVIPPLVKQASQVAGSIPTSIDDIRNQNTPIVRFINDHQLTEQYTQLVSGIKDNLQVMEKRAVSTLSTVGGAIISVITVLVLTFMMLVEGPEWMERFWLMQPKSELDERKLLVHKMYRMVTGYVNGQFVVATIAASFALIAMLIASTVFGVTINVVALALIVGLIGLIPMIGNTLAAIIVVTVCLFVSVPLAITMAVFFLVYQQVENVTLQPYIQSKYNELTPLTVFVAALIGVGAGGFLGALIAIPLAGCLRILLIEFYGHKLNLHDSND